MGKRSFLTGQKAFVITTQERPGPILCQLISADHVMGHGTFNFNAQGTYIWHGATLEERMDQEEWHAWKRYEIKYGIVHPKRGSDNGTSI